MPKSILIDTIHSLSLNLSASSSELESSWGGGRESRGSSPCASKAIPDSGHRWPLHIRCQQPSMPIMTTNTSPGHHKIICLRTSALRKRRHCSLEPPEQWERQAGASLVAQWFRICPTLQCKGHWFCPWSQKIPHATGQLTPCNIATEPTCSNYWSRELIACCSATGEATTRSLRTPVRVACTRLTQGKPACDHGDSSQPTKKESSFKK